MTDANDARVSEIRESPRRPGRYELKLEPSGEKLPVSVELIAELKLKIGRELTEQERTKLLAASRIIACYDKSIATLGARARSSADLKRWLKTKEFTDVEITPTLEKLGSLGLLDDHAFARAFARSRLAPSRGFGPRRVAAELARKGVSRAITDAVLAELQLEQDEADEDAAGRGEKPASAAELAAAKKVKSLAKLAPEVRKRQLYAYLARRGFGGAEISAVLRKL